MGIFHIVMLAFSPSTEAAQQQDAITRFLALKDNCVKADTKKPYIKTATGGKQNSPEDHSGGLTHIFMIEFENEEDRKYYLEKDEAHLTFVKSLGGGLVTKVQVVDFTPGEF
ncbi:unnamed protein product [Discula destructiva]